MDDARSAPAGRASSRPAGTSITATNDPNRAALPRGGSGSARKHEMSDTGGVSIDTTHAPIAIQLTDIVKRFPGVVANDGVNLTVHQGSVHAIVGENGAGKSTLMKTLYGAHQPNEGTITVKGEQRVFASPKDAIADGIGMVFQAFMLAANLTVWENIVLGQEPGTKVSLNASEARRRIRDLGERYGLQVDPDALIADLGVGDKQRVEILKVLYRGAEILILDEPTAVLVPQEVDALFTSLRELTTEGATIIFISHKLDEVLKHADAITVIRQGKTVGEIPDPSSVTSRDLAEMMVGSELPTPETRESTVTDQAILELRDITVRATDDGGRDLVHDVSFTVHRGEIVGIAGVEGNGQSELVRSLVGLVPSTGTVLVDGNDVARLSTRERRDAGIGYISEDRQKDGLVLGFTLWENAALGHHHRAPFAKGPWLDLKGTKARTEVIIEEFDVRTPGIDVPAFTLSGGNQQKLVVGREMTAEPKVLVAAHPTRGVDVGAQSVIWDILRDARAAGLGTVLVSADLEELIGLSDRLLVMLRGEIVAEVDPSTVTPAELGSYMTGAKSGAH
jgi:general nucleoside transport system ATP-binding protein